MDVEKLKKEVETLRKENQSLRAQLEYRNENYPTTIRVKNLAHTLDIIQNLFKATGGQQQKQAEVVLNAIRMTYGIPADGEQIELFNKK